MPDRLGAAGAERVGGIDEIARDTARRIGDHHELLEEGAEDDDRHPLLDADADPQDEQRHERGDRQIADEIDQRIERRLHDAERAHIEAERHGDRGGDDETQKDDFDAGPDMYPQRAVRGQNEEAVYDRVRHRQKHVGDILAIGRDGPGTEHQQPNDDNQQRSPIRSECRRKECVSLCQRERRDGHSGPERAPTREQELRAALS